MSGNDYYQHTLELLEDSYLAADERGDPWPGVRAREAAWRDGSASGK